MKRWSDKWSKNEVGWHIRRVNPYLQKHFQQMIPEANVGNMGSRILIPFCGKTVDMAFLAKCGFRVVGMDGVKKALDEFAKEQGVTKELVPIDLPPEMGADRYNAFATLIPAAEGAGEPSPPVILIQGDFMDLGQAEADVLVPFDAAFDRGSLVAVEPKDRRKYASAMGRMIAPGGRVLLCAVEHDAFKDGRLGPPFEVTEMDIRTLFSEEFDVTPLERDDKPEEFADRGCKRFTEAIYLLTRKATEGAARPSFHGVAGPPKL